MCLHSLTLFAGSLRPLPSRLRAANLQPLRPDNFIVEYDWIGGGLGGGDVRLDAVNLAGFSGFNLATKNLDYAFQFEGAGNYRCRVYYLDFNTGTQTDVRDSPFSSVVFGEQTNTVPSESSAFGHGLAGSIAGQTNWFQVQARDTLGVDRATGGGGIYSATDTNDDGEFTDADRPLYPTFPCRRQTDPAACAADALACDQCPGIEVLPADPTQQITFVAQEGAINDLGEVDGTFTIWYNATVADTYTFDIELCLGFMGCADAQADNPQLAMYTNRAIAGLPLSVTVIAADVQASMTVFDADRCIAGQGCSIPCTPRDAYGNTREYNPATGPDVTGFTATPTGGIQMVGTVTDLEDGTVVLVFDPTVATDYGIRLTWLEQPTDYRDVYLHTVEVVPYVTSTRNCVATGSGITAVAMAGVESAFTIIAKDRYNNLIRGGGATFSMDLSSGGDAEMGVTDNEDGTYVASYMLLVAGTHQLVVARAGYDIDGSAFTITVVANEAYPPNCFVDALNLGQVTPLIPSTFTVTVYDEYNNLRTVGDELVVVVATVNPASGPPEVSDGAVGYVANGQHSATYSISTYIVTAGGSVSVSVTLNNQTLPGSPFGPHLLLANPPVPVSSQFSSMARTILVVFDQDTDRAGTFEPVECEYYFTTESSNTLGQGKECLWQGDKDLLIVLGIGATVLVDDTLMLTSAADTPSIRTKLGNSRATSGGITVAAPADPVRPNVVISAADSYADCDEILIDASATSGGAGRDMEYQWGVEPNIPGFTALSDLMRTQEDTTVILPPYNLTAGIDYVFHLQARNFFGEIARGSTHISISALPLPQISVGDGSAEVHTIKGNALFLNARVVLSRCMPPELSEMAFTWTLVGWSATEAITLDVRTKNTRTLVIPKDTLEPGTWYDLRLDGHSVQNVSYAGSANVRVVVDYSPVTAVISGGDRIVSRLSPIQLSAAASIDPDDLPAEFTYTWGCYRTTDIVWNPLTEPAQCFSDVTGLLVASLPVLTLPIGLLQQGEQVFTVTVAKEKGVGNVEVSSASVVLTVKSESVPTVSIAAGDINPTKINPSSKIVLRSLVDETVTEEYADIAHDVQWDCVAGGFNTSDTSLRASSMDNPALVLLPSVLSPGQTYRFRLSSDSITPDGGSGAATIELAVNLKPSGGRFAVSPGNGLFDTLFELRASGWIDEDLPLAFEFRRIARDVSFDTPYASGCACSHTCPPASLVLPTLGVVH